jgi:hypothetical protein
MSDSMTTDADHQPGRGARKRPRQNPGPACRQCRVRKLRCDRQTPCNGCVDAGVECHIDTTPPQRGPKKGHLQTLRLRIGEPTLPPGSPLGVTPDARLRQPHSSAKSGSKTNMKGSPRHRGTARSRMMMLMRTTTWIGSTDNGPTIALPSSRSLLLVPPSRNHHYRHRRLLPLPTLLRL